MSARSVVVVGGSLGGARTAQALRSAGYDGRLVLVGEEPELPYDRPPLSKGVLRDEDVPVLLTEADAAQLDLTLRLGVAAVGLDLADGCVVLSDGDRLPFDDVVVATGSRPRPSPWGTPPGVHLLRTRADAAALRDDLRRGGRLVVVGAGFIGAEVSATARALGVEVTLVDPLPAPMSRVLGAEVGGIFTELHRRHGVETRLGAAVADIESTPSGPRVVLADGEVLPATSVLVGCGALPNDDWLRSSGLELADGLVCDQYCRSTSDERVHAVGDVARWWHPRHGESVRIEHWTNAVEQAAVVAHNIVSPDRPRAYAPVEYVWSDQYDWKVQLVGRTLGAPVRMLGEPADRRFAVVYGAGDGRLGGLLAVNWPRAVVAARRAVAGGEDIEALVGALQAVGSRGR